MGQVLDWCESIATIMGHEAIYISTDHIGLYERYGYVYLRSEKNTFDEECRIYRKPLQTGDQAAEDRKARGNVWKASVVAQAKQHTDHAAV